jgi:hypothetical protein
VNSYRDLSAVDYYGGLSSDEDTRLAQGFRTVYKRKKGGLRFSDLLDQVSRIDPEMRIRFTSPHPKDFPDEVNNSLLFISTSFHFYGLSIISVFLTKYTKKILIFMF